MSFQYGSTVLDTSPSCTRYQPPLPPPGPCHRQQQGRQTLTRPGWPPTATATAAAKPCHRQQQDDDNDDNDEDDNNCDTTTATRTTRRLGRDGSEYEQLGLASGRLDDGSTLHARPIVVAPTATMVKRWQPEKWDDADDSFGSECCRATTDATRLVVPVMGNPGPWVTPGFTQTRTRMKPVPVLTGMGTEDWVRVQMGKFAGWHRSTTVRLRQAASSLPPAVVASPRSTAVCPVVTVVVVAAVENPAVVAIAAAVVAIITAVIVVIISIVVAVCSELHAASPSHCCWGATAVVLCSNISVQNKSCSVLKKLPNRSYGCGSEWVQVVVPVPVPVKPIPGYGVAAGMES
ncbi:hypothetical protein EDB85DRAFT_1898929 [Lactarius pseudohatsudake]|nr:hypothetical protein EDB85DRAFT_1898929 [Lactarius pseudohatsudake]